MQHASHQALCLWILTALAGAAAAQQPALRVHEWGTFTSLQDDDGRAISGVNAEDEPLPEFVHRSVPMLLIGPGDIAPIYFQGAAACHPDATMRLETPVLYFHPRQSAAPMTVDVEVAWRGGWLTEYYPTAEAVLPGVDDGPHGRIRPDAAGTLRWSGVTVGGAHPGPATDAHVWLAPRRVAAADVLVGGEGERFLFYRGVGNLDAPLRVRRDGAQLVLHGQVRGDLATRGLTTGPVWLADIDAERGTAYRRLPGLPLGDDPDKEIGRVAARFAPDDHAPGRLGALRAEMHTALVEDGLFADEATALLETWKVSYFESDGLRLFFLVPQAWTDHVLPLRVSAPHTVTTIERVMVGRIELVSERQRALLRRIAAGPTSDGSWFRRYLDELPRTDPERFQREWQRLCAEPGAAMALGLELPADYRAWLGLGRFRHALVLDELRRRPTDALAAFVGAYGLE